MPRLLFTPHARALTVLHADLENHAAANPEAFVGTAGSVVERSNAAGYRFYVHQGYDGHGRRHERYLLGPVGAKDADAAAEGVRARVRELKELVPSLRLLGREGFSLVDRKTYAVLASLHNAGVFAAGGVLIGSHAYGVLLNRLGVRAAAYATEDIDLARRRTLTFHTRPELGLLGILRSSGIDFVEVPELGRKRPATSFKERGRSRFHVDLLAPSSDEAQSRVAVPELAAHATGLPYLGYLLAETQLAMVMSREGCCTVRVPLPERFAVHKLVIASLRRDRSAKSAHDVDQACVLAAALAASHPGALESARAQVPRPAKRHLARGLDLARPRLETAHLRAWDELSGHASGA